MKQSDSLAEWERELRKRLDGADLLCEAAPISEEETRQLGQLIGARFTNIDWDRVEATIRADFPYSFAVYLVFQGIHGYEEGDYWSGVRKSTGLDLSSTQQGEWGRLFESIVARRSFARFPLLRGHRYVGPILAHGGIPDSSLPVFFDRFIHPWITRTEYVALSAREFIAERVRLSSAEVELDKPILRFLRFGGEIAEDFADRCRDLVLRTIETGTMPSADEVGLSPRVTEQYRQCCEQNALNVVQDKFRGFRAPILIVEPWGVGPMLYFPPQNPPLDSSRWQITWQVYGDTSLLREWPAMPHMTEGTYVPLLQVAKEYRAELTLTQLKYTEYTNRKSFKRVWRYRGMTKDCPVMLFDASTKKQILSKTILPASQVWLYHYPDTQLEARPPATLRVIEELPQLPWEWSTLRGQLIDLTDVEELMVLKANTGASVSEFAVYKEDQHLLLGGERFTTDDNGPPLYSGTPPNLSIPLHGTSLSKWNVRIYNEEPASPDVDVGLTLEELDKHGHLADEHKSVMLKLDGYLGTSPLGNYGVTVRGALGHKFDLRFRMLPFLDMVGHDTLHVPEEGQPKIQFLLETRSDVGLSVQTGERDCSAMLIANRNGKSMYEITVGEDVSNVPLQFSSRKSTEQLAVTTILVPVRRLRWMITLNQEETRVPKWRTTPLRLALNTLEQNQEPYLLVDLFGGVCDHLEVTVLLVNDEERTLQEERAVFKKGQSPARFDLRAFLDTIRHSRSASCLKLHIRGLPSTVGYISIPVLFVTSGFPVEHAEVTTISDQHTIRLSLRWEPDASLMHRFVRFWPVWRPWDKPLTIDLPDKLHEQYDFSLSRGKLITGRYLLEFGVHNPWLTEQSSVMPRSDDPTIISVFIPQDAAERRLDELANLGKSEELSFAVMLERACIRQDLDQYEMARADFQWCIDNLDTAEVGQVLDVERCVSSEPDLFALVRRKMARADHVKQAVDEYQTGKLAEDSYREYLQLLPRDSLLPSDTCEVLLNLDDEQLRLYAAHQLLHLGKPSGVQAVIEWVRRRELSETVAIDLLGNNIPLTVTTLKDAFPDETAMDLLKKLGSEYPHQVPAVVVRAGCWVRCVAGWGQIKHIKGPAGREIEQFVHTESKCMLHVLLRAHDKHNAEPVLVDLDKKTVTFLNESDVYTCSECRHFSTQDYGLMTSLHGPVAHEAKTPGFCISKSVTLSQEFELEFLPAQPRNPWA